ncbi:MAG TPA: hypothetical protein VFE19_02505 [Jatrophihabitantaceae bacterium]|nr:hypothetical protein [Jatrophihabitantaceae bacterium]
MNRSASLSRPELLDSAWHTVNSLQTLQRQGWTRSGIRAQLEARRWQRVGRAVVGHNSVLTDEEKGRAVLLNCGPRAALTAFTAAEVRGLTGWHRDEVHVAVPAGARICRPEGIAIRVHWTGNWGAVAGAARNGLALLPYAVVAAAETFPKPRPACGILAAAVQQRLATADDLRVIVRREPRLRHRALLLSVVDDIAGGAQALSEIDFARLCRRNGLPEPTRQAIRTDRFGKRRYLDAEWRLPNGRVVVVEIDGALHLIYRQWWDDSLRQNELVLTGSMVLRYPSALVRCDQATIVDQLVRALL